MSSRPMLRYVAYGPKSGQCDHVHTTFATACECVNESRHADRDVYPVGFGGALRVLPCERPALGLAPIVRRSKRGVL